MNEDTTMKARLGHGMEERTLRLMRQGDVGSRIKDLLSKQPLDVYFSNTNINSVEPDDCPWSWNCMRQESEVFWRQPIPSLRKHVRVQNAEVRHSFSAFSTFELATRAD